MSRSSAPPEPDHAPRARADDLLTTGDMARLSNNTLRTVRFYEEEQILQPARRSDGGHRLFPRSELDRLLLVSELREAGLSLEEIKDVLAMKNKRGPASVAGQRALRLVQAHVRALEEKLEVLARLKRDLTSTSELLEVCAHCNDGSFPEGCHHCESMGDPGKVPLPMRVVWGVSGTETPADGDRHRRLPTTSGTQKANPDGRRRKQASGRS